MTILKHKKTGRIYHIVHETCQIKIGNDWVEGFCYYESRKPMKVYVRPKEELNKFEIVYTERLVF